MLRRLMPRLILLLAVAMSTANAGALDDLNRQLTDLVIVPGYQGFASATGSLDVAMARLCEEPTPETLSAARQGFAQAMLAWQRVQAIAFGPVAEGRRISAIQLFPDRRAISRQLDVALAAKAPELVAPGGLGGKSVALTGFPALERILHDDARLPSAGAASADTAYACALAAAIARNLATLAASLLDEWRAPGGFRDQVLTAAAGNDAFFDAEEVSANLLESLHDGLQTVVALKLEPPLGKSLEEARPKDAESWRSGLSLANIRANLETARALYASPGGFADALALIADEGQLDRAIRQGFERAFATLDQIDVALPLAVADPRRRPQVEALLGEVKGLGRLVALELAPALDLVVGFNALDGD